MSIDIAVVPVAGRGTRLLPLTKSQPKEMLPLGRKPTVHHVVEELVLAGMKRILFVTGPGKTAIENHFDIDVELERNLRESGQEDLLLELNFQRDDTEYFYTRQRRQLGLGHAILCAKPFVGDQPFAVALGDSIIGLNNQSRIMTRMVDEFERSGADAVIAFQEVPRSEVSQYGIAKPRGEPGDVFELDDLIEKPSIDTAPSNLAVAARYICRSSTLEMLSQTEPGKGGEIQLTDAFRLLLKRSGRVLGVRLPNDENRYDVGNFESYFRALIDSVFADPQYGPAMQAHARRRLAQDDG